MSWMAAAYGTIADEKGWGLADRVGTKLYSPQEEMVRYARSVDGWVADAWPENITYHRPVMLSHDGRKW